MSGNLTFDALAYVRWVILYPIKAVSNRDLHLIRLQDRIHDLLSALRDRDDPELGARSRCECDDMAGFAKFELATSRQQSAIATS